MNIFVGNVSRMVSDTELRTAFEQYGSVESAVIIKDRETGDSRGFGFVEMADEGQANDAIESLNGFELKGRKLNVNQARPREDRPKRDRFQRGRFNRQ
ncbi:MAG: RNA-binding protein [Candidatus Cloacimonetes bacterium]|nr:RNA-binding protein [Candidatus Cloacimonadota bacterium]MDD4156791.1 RNA-binding protein [Candidatus Cloacimonadota bacterium]